MITETLDVLDEDVIKEDLALIIGDGLIEYLTPYLLDLIDGLYDMEGKDE